MKDKVVKLTQGNLCPEVEKSQVRRQERDQNSNPWKQDKREVSSHSIRTRNLVQTQTPRTEFEYMKYTNHQYMTRVFHFLHKKLGITAGHSTFSMEALKTNVLIWGMFVSSSMKAAIYLEPNYLTILEI